MPAYLGEFEHLLLLAVLRLGSDAYGLDIARELEARAGRSVSRGALYTSLDRLEDKGLLRWKPSPGSLARSGLGMTPESRPKRVSLSSRSKCVAALPKSIVEQFYLVCTAQICIGGDMKMKMGDVLAYKDSEAAASYGAGVVTAITNERRVCHSLVGTRLDQVQACDPR